MSTAASFAYHTELIDGVEREKPLPKNFHSFIQTFLVQRLGNDVPSQYRVLSEMNIICGQDRLIPDITVALRESHYVEGDLVSPPLLAIEIMSPGQRLGSLIDKSERLVECGAQACWIIWPEKRQAWLYTTSGLIEQADTLRALDGSLTVSLPELWEQLT